MTEKNDLNAQEFRTLVALARRILWTNHGTRGKLQELGINIVPARFYSDIPSHAEIMESFESREDRPFHFDFLDIETLINTLGQLDEYAEEFDPPVDIEKNNGFFWNNPAFSFTDAMSYYCFIRWAQPKCVLEIGSGYSTLVAVAAARKNGGTRVLCVEPYPLNFLKELKDIDLIMMKAQDVTPEFIDCTLSDGDVLFIDLTHTVKMGSDCVHLYLRILPRIARRLLVHVHDIRLPRGLNAQDALERHIYWTEQHLLSAYLLDNPKIRVLYGSAWAMLDAPDALARMMRGRYAPGGASFWFELNGAPQRGSGQPPA